LLWGNKIGRLLEKTIKPFFSKRGPVENNKLCLMNLTRL
jgi:hypothetical protein